MAFTVGRRSFGKPDRLDVSAIEEAEKKRLALEARLDKLGREAVAHSADHTMDGLQERLPDGSVLHLRPEEAIRAICPKPPEDPNQN